MKSLILKYNQLNESNELDDLSVEEVGRLIELGIIDHPDLIRIYNFLNTKSTRYLNLPYSHISILPSWLKVIHSYLNISHSNIEDIPDSLEIYGGIYARYSKLKEFRRTRVFGDLNLDYTQITKLPDNLKVDGFLSVEGIQFEEIPVGLQIDDNLNIRGSNLEQFSDDELRKMYDLRYISRTQ